MREWLSRVWGGATRRGEGVVESCGKGEDAGGDRDLEQGVGGEGGAGKRCWAQ